MGIIQRFWAWRRRRRYDRACRVIATELYVRSRELQEAYGTSNRGPVPSKVTAERIAHITGGGVSLEELLNWRVPKNTPIVDSLAEYGAVREAVRSRLDAFALGKATLEQTDPSGKHHATLKEYMERMRARSVRFGGPTPKRDAAVAYVEETLADIDELARKQRN